MTDSNPCIDKLFRDARTHGAWLDKPVSDEALRELYNALKWGPTSANASPARFVFIRTAKNKERPSRHSRRATWRRRCQLR